MTTPIYFGDKPLIEGPPVGDGLFVVACGSALYIRWCRSGMAYETREDANSGLNSRSKQANYDAHLFITPWPEPVAAVERDFRCKVGSNSLERHILIRVCPDDDAPWFFVNADTLQVGWVDDGAADAADGTYCDPWAQASQIAELEAEVERLKNASFPAWLDSIASMKRVLADVAESTHGAMALAGALAREHAALSASPAVSTEGK